MNYIHISLFTGSRILLYYFLISLVKAIPINPAPIPTSHPAWVSPNIDPTPPPRNMQPTNTNPPIPQFGRSIVNHIPSIKHMLIVI